MPNRRRHIKVPQITGYFWTVKLFTTAMGEATSDFLVHHFNPYLTVMVGAVAFCLALWAQFTTRRYNTVVYWLAVTMVAVFGTMVADAAHVALGVPYYASSLAFAVALAAVFTAWHRSEGTLSIHSVWTVRREAFYWATVSATFALGTATGDMTAQTLRLGYFASSIIFAALFLLPGLLRRMWGLNEVVAFWFAYVMTRPLGASIADWWGFPHSVGGMGLGKGPVALVLTFCIVVLVAYLARTRKDVPDAPE